MQQEFEPKLPRNILKTSWNKSFYFRARFGVIYSAFRIENYLLKNSTIGNRLLFYELENIVITCLENSNSRERDHVAAFLTLKAKWLLP